MSAPDYDFLNEEASAPAVVEPTPEPAAPVEPAPAPVAAAPAAPTAAEPHEQNVPLAALKAEREKRQAAERRAQELEQARQQQPEPPPNFYEAPEQYVQTIAQRVQAQTQQQLYAALDAAAREQHTDYDEVLGELAEAVKDNPLLQQQVWRSPNPALAAYKLGKQLRDLKAMQDPATYRAKVEAEVRAQLKAEQDAAEKAKAAAAAAIPPDLSAARSARDEPVAEPDDLDSILATRRKR